MYLYKHEKPLFHPVGSERPNPQYAVMMQEQLGGANGEMKAAMQYMSQSFRVKDPKIKDLFMDIAAEELGHMEMVAETINLLNGHQDLIATLIQIVFAASLGFVFTMAYLKSGSLRPVIIAHSLIDMFAVFARYSRIADWAYIIASIVLAALYCPFLAKLEDKALKE